MSTHPVSTLELVDLPPELLVNIFNYLEPEEISKLSKLCRAFHRVSRIDSLWRMKCLEFPIDPFPNDAHLQFRAIYTKVLYKYGKLLGFWTKSVGHYGGFIQVKFDSNLGKIVGKEWSPSANQQNVTDQLKPSPVFCIEIDEQHLPSDGGSVVLCCSCASTLPRLQDFHNCDIVLGNQIDGKIHNFQRKCLSPHLHQAEHEETNASLTHRIMQIRRIALLSYMHCLDFVRWDWPLHRNNVVIQPGLFKGDYGGHGIELIKLTFDEATTKAFGTKVTGDPNIPAGEITFVVNLSDALLVSREEQETMRKLRDVQVLGVIPGPLNQLPIQPFIVPFGITGRTPEMPDYCKARFSGLGQIAFDGYINSSFIEGHWIVFTEDLFAFMWFDLKSLSMFHRVQQIF